MKKIIAMYKKEMGLYLNNPLGYIIIILFGVFANFLYIKDLFLRDSSSLRPFFDVVPWILLIFIPAISMRTFSEEKRTNTIELLLTLPVSPLEITLAKFFALQSLLALSISLTFSLPYTISRVGTLAGGEVIVSYVGLFLLGSSFAAIAMFFSALTKNQIISLLMSILSLFILYVFGTQYITPLLSKQIQEVLVFLTPSFQYEVFLKGLLDLRAVLYFISLTFAALFLTVVGIERRI